MPFIPPGDGGRTFGCQATRGDEVVKYIASLKHPDTTGPIELEVEAEYLSDAENKADELFESKFHAVTFGMEITVRKTEALG